MLDFCDETPPEVVDDIPGERAAQLRNTQPVNSTARICFRADAGFPSAVTGDDNPHRCTYDRSLCAIPRGSSKFASQAVGTAWRCSRVYCDYKPTV
jgi:hypothetical protein